MTLRQVKSYGSLWQKRLRLTDWAFEYRWMTHEEVKERPEWNGYCQWNEQHKIATITLAKEGEDIRHTIIHELNHIRIEGHTQQLGDTNVPLEFAINALCGAFLELEALGSKKKCKKKKLA